MPDARPAAVWADRCWLPRWLRLIVSGSVARATPLPVEVLTGATAMVLVGDHTTELRGLTTVRVIQSLAHWMLFLWT